MADWLHPEEAMQPSPLDRDSSMQRAKACSIAAANSVSNFVVAHFSSIDIFTLTASRE